MSTKISDMTPATDLTGAVVPIVQGGVNKKADADLFGGGSNYEDGSFIVRTGEPEQERLTINENGDAVINTQYTQIISGDNTFNTSNSEIYLDAINAIFLLQKNGGSNTDEFSKIEIILEPSNIFKITVQGGLFLINTAPANGTPEETRFKIDENGNITLPTLPTDPTGLSEGMLYNDNGTIKIVLP
jgi:hypothetical protein